MRASSRPKAVAKIVGIFHTGIDTEDQYWGIVPTS